MMQPPKTRYARNGDVSIAYQVIGDGPMDLLFTPAFVSHLDLYWSAPETTAFFRWLASFSRLILFDKRGTGLSDPVSDAGTLEERMQD
jgi:pimeloyl-ACP methyl ester carboxylesterase